ncbi:YceI family protein [Paenibacillus sp. USHLN196]
MRSEDFFHAAKYPSVTFQSTSCVLAGERQYELAGNLTQYGATNTFHTFF